MARGEGREARGGLGRRARGKGREARGRLGRWQEARGEWVGEMKGTTHRQKVTKVEVNRADMDYVITEYFTRVQKINE